MIVSNYLVVSCLCLCGAFTVSSNRARLPLARGGGLPRASDLFSFLCCRPPRRQQPENWVPQILRLTYAHPCQARDGSAQAHSTRANGKPHGLVLRSHTVTRHQKCNVVHPDGSTGWPHPRLFAFLAHQRCGRRRVPRASSRIGICSPGAPPLTDGSRLQRRRSIEDPSASAYLLRPCHVLPPKYFQYVYEY